jgi:hypothetical protein
MPLAPPNNKDCTDLPAGPRPLTWSPLVPRAEFFSRSEKPTLEIEWSHPAYRPATPFSRRASRCDGECQENQVMTQTRISSRRSMIARSAVAAIAVLVAGTIACGQTDLSEPVYRVANETSAAEPTAAPASVSATTPATNAAFDFAQQPNEHPLAPVIRALKTSQEIIDQNIRDYSCTFIKRERVDGQLGEHQHILMKVAHEPFSVYMSFLQPFAGREVLYVAGQNDNKMVVLEAGFKRYLGKLNLDPEGAVAMRGQKHPITRVGIRNLTAELIKLWEAETQYAECEVTVNADTKVEGRPATLVQVMHPVPRQTFRGHVQRLFLDNELRIPIHYDVYLWPAQEGAEPPLDESYTYKNLKINNGFTALDFDPNNNPAIFK